MQSTQCQPLKTIRPQLEVAKHDRSSPILTHLNADTSWLLQLPLPANSTRPSGRSYFNILIDPWLTGSGIDLASWFSQQWHVTESAVGSIREVEELICALEGQDDVEAVDYGQKEGAKESKGGDEENGISPIDVILISHEFSDHCHKETLLGAHSHIPVFAMTGAAKLIRSWNHFKTVREIPDFAGKGADWRKLCIEPLPDSIGIGRVPSPGCDLLYFHSAVLITFTGPTSSDRTQGLIYTPHGVSPKGIEHLPTADPPIDVLALLHGLHDVTITSWINSQFNKRGAHNGLRVQRLLQAKYWIGTHDEQTTAGGIIAFLLRTTLMTLKEALEREAEEEAGDETVERQAVEVVELGNGDSMILK